MSHQPPDSTGPLSSASSGRWTAKCTITSKKASGYIFSRSHRIVGILSLRRSKASILIFLLQSSLKNCPNSAAALYKSGRPNPLRITGKTLWSRTWQSWVFNPCTLFPSALTLLSGLEANQCGNLARNRTSQNSFLFTLSKTYIAGAISRGLPSSCTCKSFLIPRCVKSILDFKVSFVLPSIEVCR